MNDSGKDPRGLEGEKRRAIVVEDNAANLYFSSKILRTHGLDTIAVSNYAEALHVVSHVRGDLLLADIVLGSGNGISLAQWAVKCQPHLKVLLMTAYLEQELRANILGWPVIRNPFTSRDLIGAVERVVRG